MTQTVPRPRQRTGKAPVPAVLPTGLPQVNLLPESVRAVRRLREVRGWFGLAVLVALLVVLAAWFLAGLAVTGAEDDRAAEEQRTSTLLAEQAGYAEVTPVMHEAERLGAAMLLASGSEVDWSGYTDAIAAVLPDGVQLTTLAVQTVGADGSGGAPTDPLITPGVQQLTLSARATAAPPVADLVDALDAVPGLADARVSVLEREAEQDYLVTATVQVTTTARSARLMGEAG